MSASSVLRSLAGEVIDFLVFVGELLGGASADQAREAILRDLGAKPGSGGLVLPAASMDSVKAYRDRTATAQGGTAAWRGVMLRDPAWRTLPSEALAVVANLPQPVASTAVVARALGTSHQNVRKLLAALAG